MNLRSRALSTSPLTLTSLSAFTCSSDARRASMDESSATAVLREMSAMS